MRSSLFGMLVLVAWGMGFPGAIAAAQELPAAASVIPTGSKIATPAGWKYFCRRHQSGCAAWQAPVVINLTEKKWQTISVVNRTENLDIRPVDAGPQWHLPVGNRGDCKEYTLEKREKLLEAGFPASALLVTIVNDLAGELHMILVVKTDRGDFVLDNLSSGIVAWDKTGYMFLQQQAPEDPNLWRNFIAPGKDKIGDLSKNRPKS